MSWLWKLKYYVKHHYKNDCDDKWWDRDCDDDKGHKPWWKKDHCPPCFVRGVRIATPSGEVAVEDLRVGDLVLTKDNGAQPVRWIGATTIGAARLAAEPELGPIRIKAGALGDNLPTRDLLVSPEHAMLLTDWRAEIVADAAEVLAPAQLLVNDDTIRPIEMAEVEYFHLLFDAHEIVFAEGAETESYRPCGENHKAFDAERQAELLALFPELEDDASAYGESARRILRDVDVAAMRAL